MGFCAVLFVFGPRNLPGARLSLPARLHGPVLRPLLLFEQGIASRLKRHFCKWYLDWFITQTITAATKYKLKTDQGAQENNSFLGSVLSEAWENKL